LENFSRLKIKTELKSELKETEKTAKLKTEKLPAEL
jgi:hypothetical protein